MWPNWTAGRSTSGEMSLRSDESMSSSSHSGSGRVMYEDGPGGVVYENGPGVEYDGPAEMGDRNC